MTLVLLYLVVLVLVAIVLFGVGSLIFGRGERLPPLPRATTATVLPASGVTGADVDAVKFTQVMRGYKTSEVDWVLDRLGQELDELRAELALLRHPESAPGGEVLESRPPGRGPQAGDVPAGPPGSWGVPGVPGSVAEDRRDRS
ncbi:DivIVA domain-containing protein [Mycolicibacterium palauense]|uniref:DivIVA domain-containing protein n=1 Tax=Mycolicibacterium palauense TaxID=2034511 RepID=UPI000BFF00FF|nr:DivIVA domain-containing protein [Mycolicibacterium palauense]